MKQHIKALPKENIYFHYLSTKFDSTLHYENFEELDTDGIRCINLQHADLDDKDIETILHWHNTYRNTVASGKEIRGNPGPQRPAKFMMEVMWDDELALIARRWVVQCNLLEKDQCRDVGKYRTNDLYTCRINVMIFKRFGVWQNVHIFEIDNMGNLSSIARIRFHIQSWYDEVEDFDSAEFGLVNFVAKSNLPYIPFALSTISRIGCGRAIYTQRSRFKVKNMATSSTEHTIAIAYGEVRVEALVCNYGPLDWNTPRELYEDGVPAVCPAGTMRSTQYRALCRKIVLDACDCEEWYN
ncbi:Venom allergen [Apis cerana cerana]|uniref:Venom allergen n=1 Tax=Apis cerana cerana TaxID=94128 RepID=A0A2A3EKS9_APICC|nr:Venom allergen [Apis cerana cerana]